MPHSRSPKRARRVADLVQREIAALLRKAIADPRLHQLSITEVVVSPDLGQAKIYYVLPDNADKKAVATALNKATGYIRHLLAEHTALRYTPKLVFVYDEAIIRAERISELINQATKANNQTDESNEQ